MNLIQSVSRSVYCITGALDESTLVLHSWGRSVSCQFSFLWRTIKYGVESKQMRIHRISKGETVYKVQLSCKETELHSPLVYFFPRPYISDSSGVSEFLIRKKENLKFNNKEKSLNRKWRDIASIKLLNWCKISN